MYVRGIYFGCVSDIFLLDFGTVLTVWYVLAGVFFFTSIFALLLDSYKVSSN